MNNKIKKGIKLHARKELLSELNQIRDEVRDEKPKGGCIGVILLISALASALWWLFG